MFASHHVSTIDEDSEARVPEMCVERVRILAVCHANLCRSPMAERLLRHALSTRGVAGFEVVSAGVSAWSGRPMHPYAADVLGEYGAEPEGFRSRRLTIDDVRSADLILAATRRQRSACVTMAPSRVRQAFTFLQFGRLAAALPAVDLRPDQPPAERLRSMVREFEIVRGTLGRPGGDADDLGDPVDQPVERFRRCARELQAVIDVLLDQVAPAQPVEV